MDTVTFELPAQLYAALSALAEETHTDPVELIARLVEMASGRRAWLSDLAALRAQIQADGGLQVGSTKEQVVESLRKTRQEIFEAEYAHLYG